MMFVIEKTVCDVCHRLCVMFVNNMCVMFVIKETG